MPTPSRLRSRCLNISGGSGGDEIKAVLFDHDGLRETRAEVEALNENLLSLRTTQWDEREAIVLLHSGDGVVSTFNDPDRYWMTSFRNNGEDGYTVASRWEKAVAPRCRRTGGDGQGIGRRAAVLDKSAEWIPRREWTE